MTRCKSCGHRVRGKSLESHEAGADHRHDTKRLITQSANRAKRGPRAEVKTPPKSKGHGFDFSAIKRGGMPK